MGIRRDRIISECLKISHGILLIAYCLLLIAVITSCGRRGDPVAISPYDEKSPKEGQVTPVTDKEAGPAEVPKEEKKDGQTGAVETVQPDAPSGLGAIFTGKSIVIVWDEIKGQNITSYNIYRSSGGGFELVGFTVTPAFTDRDIKPDTDYVFKITAFGTSEGPPSKELKITTHEN